jgi:integrase
MGLRAMRGKWQYRFRIQGSDVCVMTGLDVAIKRNEKKAEQMEAAHRQAIMEGRWGFNRSIKARAFADALPEFLAWCKVEYQAHEQSWRRIQTSMASCSRFFEKKMVSMITPGDVERYKVWRLTGNSTPVLPVTVKHDLDNLSVFFQWAVKADYARLNPLKEVSRPSDAEAIRQRVLTPAEESLYFAHASGNLYAVARLILLQGCRPEEVMRMRVEDVDLERGLLHIRRGKTKAARRTLKLTVESLSILAKQLANNFEFTRRPWGSAGVTAAGLSPHRRSHLRPPKTSVNEVSPWVFPSPRKPGAHITKLNGAHDRVLAKPALMGLRFVLYDLRHTAASRWAESGMDLATLAAILGHNSLRVISRYIHIQQAHMNAAMAIYENKMIAQEKVVLQ